MGGRPPAGGPDAALGRVRAAPGGQRPRARRGRRPRRRRRRPGCGRAGRGADVGPGRRPEGGEDGHRRTGRIGGDRAVREPGPRERRDRRRARAGRSGRCSPRSSTPFAAARLGVYLHGLAGDAIRERFGDSGLLASDLPEAIAIARKRLAVIAERKATAGRLGFGSRDGGPADGGSAGSDAAARRRHPATPRPETRPEPGAERGGRAANRGHNRRTRWPGRIEDRLAAAGLPPLPRTAWIEIDLEALAGNLAVARALAGPGSSSSRSSRPTPTATGWSRSPGRWSRRAPTGCASRRSTRRWRCGTPASMAG